MAIIIEGVTKRKLCGNLLLKNRDTTALPPLTISELDPLWFFNDAACHTECFQRHPLASRVLAREQTIQEHAVPSLQICDVCGERIDDPDEYIGIGPLTDGEEGALYADCFKRFHRPCLPRWSGLRTAYEKVVGARQIGKLRSISI
jgi:hypothetical protein